MDAFLNAPAVVYISLVLASVLLLIEIALPTLGIAGTCSLLLAALAIAGIVHQGDPWWPILLAVVATGLWAVMIARNEAPLGQQVAAGVLFAAGSIGYAVVSRDVLTGVIAVVASIAMPFVFPQLFEGAQRLRDRRPEVGMESFVGQRAEVVSWKGHNGSVRLEGSLWNAECDRPLSRGDRVDVRGFRGMTLEVAPHHDSPSI